MAIDVSRLAQGVVLDPVVSDKILGDVQERSVFQTLAEKIAVPGEGLRWQTITGDPEAKWVGETDEKPVSRPAFGEDALQAYKMAVIVPFSDEFKRDATGLFREVERRLPGSLARLFDRTVLGLEAAPGEYFDQLSDTTAVEYNGSTPGAAYTSLLDVDSAIAAGNGVLNGWGFAPATRNKLMRVHVDGSPVFANGAGAGDVLSTLLGARVSYSRALGEVPNLMGIAGDWTAAQWGTVSGVHLSMATEATLTETYNAGTDEAPDTRTRTLNLWQRNMFALRAEVEVAFKADQTKFARLVDAA